MQLWLLGVLEPGLWSQSIQDWMMMSKWCWAEKLHLFKIWCTATTWNLSVYDSNLVKSSKNLSNIILSESKLKGPAPTYTRKTVPRVWQLHCHWHTGNQTQFQHQCCQPPIFSPDICAKSESNPKRCVKVCTKQTLKARICNETRFATKVPILNKTLFMTKARISGIAAWTCNNWHDPCNTIYAWKPCILDGS